MRGRTASRAAKLLQHRAPRFAALRFATLTLAFASAVSSCGARTAGPQKVALEGHAVARVGDEVIVAETVGAIARAQGVDTRRALDLALFDALTAEEAKRRGLGRTTRRQLQATLARAMLDQLAEEARAEGPPTDDEVAALSARDWHRVNRPDAVVTVHAVVMVAPDADEATTAKALSVAKAIRAAVAPVHSIAVDSSPPDYLPLLGVPPPGEPPIDEFIQRASSVDAQGLQVRAEFIDPVGTDELTLRRGEARAHLDSAYVTAAFALHHRGDISDPIRSAFGFHVILLLDRLRGRVLSLEERRKFFEKEIIADRTRARRRQLIDKLRAETSVDDSATNVDAILAQVKVAP